MKHKQAPLLLLSFLAAVMLFSGCTSLDPQAIATSNSMIKQFLDEHPNAQIVVTHFTVNQSKYMIDQIRSDCDNPYLDEKEFYRVNITDPDTNFYAIVWIDWETKTVECVFKIGTEGKVVERPKPPGNCTNHASSKCYNSHVYWFDSCGNVQEKKEYCQYGCSESACLGDCKSHAEYRCYGDHVYWFDSCGNKQDKKEYCNYGCENGFCKPSIGKKTCEEAGGYCIWPATATATSESGGSSAATGMVVAMEVTTTSTVISYQCKDGYGVSPNYFCKEGGICCIPNVATGFCGSSTQGPCSSDSGCITGGCSGQVCQSIKEEKGVTTCEYKDCYNAEKYGMQCKCVGTATATATGAMIQEASLEGRCMWISANQGCTDSDGGKNYYQQGTAAASGQSYTDHCNSDGTLTEKYCSGSQISAEVYQCPYGCSEGACKKEGCKQESEFCGGIAAIQCCSGLTCQLDGTYPDAGGTCVKTGQTCTDSDGGKNYYVKGIAKGYIGQIIGSRIDSCLFNGSIEEAYCDGNNISAEQYACPYGCKDGACIKESPSQPCVDSDGTNPYTMTKSTGIYYSAGKVYVGYIFGEDSNKWSMRQDTTFNYSIYYDHCYDSQTSNQLDEAYCDENGFLASTAITCPNGCSNGACIQQNQTCTDSDGGLNYYSPGSCSSCSTSGQPCLAAMDYCTDSTQLSECYCSGTNINYSYYSCPNGCSDMACIQQNQTNQVCTENTTCKINEGDTVVITTSAGNHTIKNIGLSSSSIAVISVDDITKNVQQLLTYLNVSGLKIYVQKVYFPSQVDQIGYVELIVSVSE